MTDPQRFIVQTRANLKNLDTTTAMQLAAACVELANVPGLQETVQETWEKNRANEYKHIDFHWNLLGLYVHLCVSFVPAGEDVIVESLRLAHSREEIHAAKPGGILVRPYIQLHWASVFQELGPAMAAINLYSDVAKIGAQISSVYSTFKFVYEKKEGGDGE